jgi:cyclase
MLPRTIPILLLKGAGLYKTRQFKEPKYIGDPINAVRIFNEKGVDELCVLDIDAARGVRKPDLKTLRQMAAEAFMPLSYGGGVNSCEIVQELVTSGFERVIVNSAAVLEPSFIDRVVDKFGTSTLIAAVDARRDWLGRYWVYTHGGQEKTKRQTGEWAAELARRGAGEILVTSIDRDGEMSGYDIKLIKEVVQAVNVPVIAAGGAGRLTDFAEATREGGASAVAAGSFFVFHGKHRAVLISYPARAELLALWR